MLLELTLPLVTIKNVKQTLQNTTKMTVKITPKQLFDFENIAIEQSEELLNKEVFFFNSNIKNILPPFENEVVCFHFDEKERIGKELLESCSIYMKGFEAKDNLSEKLQELINNVAEEYKGLLLYKEKTFIPFDYIKGTANSNNRIKKIVSLNGVKFCVDIIIKEANHVIYCFALYGTNELAKNIKIKCLNK